MKIIKNCFSIILAISLSFSNLASSFASGEELTKNEGKRENVYSNVNEVDTAAKEKLDNVNELIENKIAKDVNGDLEEVINSTDKVDESTDNEDGGNDISGNSGEDSKISDISDTDKDIDEENNSEINKKNEAKIMSNDADPVVGPNGGTIGEATWEISEDG